MNCGRLTRGWKSIRWSSSRSRALCVWRAGRQQGRFKLIMPEQSQVDIVGATPQAGAAAVQSSATALSEDVVLARLAQHDLSPEAIDEISQNSGLMKSRKIRLAMASQAHTPRRIALRLIRELYTFDLMQFALTPTAPADLRHAADELLISRLASITLGERIALARRS